MVPNADTVAPKPRNGALFYDPTINPHKRNPFHPNEVVVVRTVNLNDGRKAIFYHNKNRRILDMLYVGHVQPEGNFPQGQGTLYKNIDGHKSFDDWVEMLQSKNDIPLTLYTHSYTGNWKADFCLEGRATYKERKCTITGTMTSYKVDGSQKYKFVGAVNITYANGDRFKGNLHDYDVFIRASGLFTYQNGSSYRGTFPDYVNGKTTSNGCYVDQDGSTYTGSFKNDLKDGKGILWFENGDSFEGTFKEDSPVEGTLTTYPDAIRTARYVGPVSNEFEPHGEGEMVTFFNAHSREEIFKYKGHFHKGKKHGRGEQLFSNAKSFLIKDTTRVATGTYRMTGTWEKDDFRNGKVTFYSNRYDFPPTNYAREGTFYRGCQQSGKYYHSNGAVYEGSFNKNGQAEGMGMLTHRDGTIECGKWKADQRNGTFDTMQKGNLASLPGVEPQEYFYTKKTSKFANDTETTGAQQVDTKKRKRDYEAFRQSCRQRVIP